MSPTVAVLDYGSGNLRSAERALAAAGADVRVTEDVEQADSADGLVVPGVGAFAACMAGIRSVGADELIRRRVAAGCSVLGICVGMQVLFEAGDEHGEHTEGIGILPGKVTRLEAPVLPHMGWNGVVPVGGSRLFTGVGAERFYFVHSYGVPASGLPGETTATHGETTFVAAVEHGPVAATQFHPEKSGSAGGRLLRNWVATLTSRDVELSAAHGR